VRAAGAASTAYESQDQATRLVVVCSSSVLFVNIADGALVKSVDAPNALYKSGCFVVDGTELRQ
jgi:hypothetical protein